MALFGVPFENSSHAIDAVLAALNLQRDLRRQFPLSMRIGINSGVITAGMLGAQEQEPLRRAGRSREPGQPDGRHLPLGRDHYLRRDAPDRGLLFRDRGHGRTGGQGLVPGELLQGAGHQEARRGRAPHRPDERVSSGAHRGHRRGQPIQARASLDGGFPLDPVARRGRCGTTRRSPHSRLRCCARCAAAMRKSPDWRRSRKAY